MMCGMKDQLSPKEQQVFAYLQEYIRNHSFSPTLKEIKDHFKYESLTSVQRAIISLENKNRITRDRFQKRNISVVMGTEHRTVSIPVVGVVACGTPILAIENIENYQPTDEHFLRGNPDQYFYLRASGDSMNKAGIEDGDLVLIRQQKIAKDGELVVALIDDHATIKKLQKGKGYVALMPDSTNTEHKPIILREDFSIQGIVVHSFHL